MKRRVQAKKGLYNSSEEEDDEEEGPDTKSEDEDKTMDNHVCGGVSFVWGPGYSPAPPQWKKECRT